MNRMITLFRFAFVELTILYKKKYTKWLVCILAITLLFTMIGLNEERPFSGYVEEKPGMPITGMARNDPNAKQTDGYKSLELIDQVKSQLYEANANGDYKEVTRLYAFRYLLFLKMGNETSDQEYTEAFNASMIDKWNVVSGGLPYDSVVFYPYDIRISNNHYMLKGDLYRALYENDLLPVYKYDMDPLNVVYQFFHQNKVQLAMLVVFLFVLLNQMSSQSAGVIELYLVTGLRYWQYALGKWMSATFYVLSLYAVIPLLSMVVALITKGVRALYYPLIDSTKTLVKFMTPDTTLDPASAMIGAGWVKDGRYMLEGQEVMTIVAYVQNHLLWLGLAVGLGLGLFYLIYSIYLAAKKAVT